MNELLAVLKKEFEDEEYRCGYAESFLSSLIATQMRVLRQQRGFSQKRLAELMGTKQPAISRLEDVNYSTWRVATLKKIARALGVRLKISFETFGDLLHEDIGFTRESLQRPDFKDDPAFKIEEP